MLLYGPAALSGVLLAQLGTASLLRKFGVQRDQLPHTTLVGVAVYAMTLTITLQSIGILSAYCFALAGASAIVAVLLNDVLVGSNDDTSIYTLAFAQIMPIIVGGEGLLGVLDLFGAYDRFQGC